MIDQAQTIIKLKQCLKEMEKANSYPDEKSQKWVAHLATVMQAECLKLKNAVKEAGSGS